MIAVRTCALVASAVMFGGASLQAQDLSRYRDFRRGSTLASVQKISETTPSDVKVIHQRPAVIQELRWRPPTLHSSGTMEPTEAVHEATFRFYNDRLFQIVVDYDRQRTAGLTDADLIEAISGIYGVPILTSTNLRVTAVPSVMPTNGDTVVARWSDPETSLTLVRGTYPTSLRLILALTSVEVFARSASADAIRQDHDEAPQREIERVDKIDADHRVAGDKARVVNKPLFKP
jgi:hypothetical protein